MSGIIMPFAFREVCNRCGLERPVNPGLCSRCGYDQFTWLSPITRFTRWISGLFSPSVAPDVGERNIPQYAVASSPAEQLDASIDVGGSETVGLPIAPGSNQCANCGAAYQHQGGYCGYCGSALGCLCPNCNEVNDPRHQYCIYCGTSLSDPPRRRLTSHYSHVFSLSRIATLHPVVRTKATLRNLRRALDYSDADFPLPAPPGARFLTEAGIVSALMLTALFILLWNIGTVPAGLTGDEGTIALESMRILSGQWIGLWTGVELGNPTLDYYLIALLFSLGGPTVEMLRFHSAFFVVALIPVGYLMVRMLFPFRVAILFVSLLTFSSWFLIQGRIGFHVTFMVFMAAASIYLLLLSVRSGRAWIAVIGGLTLGLGLYSFKAFLIYFVAILAIAALALVVSAELRRRWVVYLYFGVALVIGLYLLEFYITSDYVGTNLDSFYNAPGFFDFKSHFKRGFEVLLYVHSPISDGGIDGIIGKPLLPNPLFPLFFWAGLLTALLFINRRPYQLLLLGWLIALAPAILVPGAESRRYLFGVFFLLIFVAIGFNAAIHLLMAWLRSRRFGWFDDYGSRSAHGIAAAAILCFVLLFAGLSLVHFYGWPKAPEARWFFAENIAEASRFLNTLDGHYEVRFYSAGVALNNEVIQWLGNNPQGSNGSVQFGGDGSITSAGPIGGDTVFILLDAYLPLAPDLQAVFPDGEQIQELDEEGNVLYIAHLVPGSLYYDPASENYRSASPPALDGARFAGLPPVGGAIVEPDPTQLTIRAAPTEHHPVHLITDESSVLIPWPDSSLVIHNNLDLPGTDACRELERRPEGDTRLHIILPEPGAEVSSPFYLVGCAPGEAALHIVSDGELLNTYKISIHDFPR